MYRIHENLSTVRIRRGKISFFSLTSISNASVQEKSRHPPLLLVTLETLLRFLSWIPLGYIFETNMVNTLIDTFFTVPMFRNVTLRCLTEIGRRCLVLSDGFHRECLLLAGIQVSQYEDKFIDFFRRTMTQLKTVN